MKSINATTWVLALAAAGITTVSAQNSTGSLANAERASRMIGNEVKARNGNRIGTLDNIIVDLQSGRVLYAVVGNGNEKLAIPPGLFRDMHGKSMDVTADAGQIKNAPKFTAQSSELNSAAYVDQVYRHFGQNEWWVGAKPADQGSFQNVHQVTDLKGVRVVNVQDQPMGDIDNVVVDLPAGRVLYVVLNPANELNLGKQLFALPPETFTANNKSGKTVFSVNIDKQSLSSAPHFASSDWSKIRDMAFASEVYRHFGKDAYFTSTSGSTLQPTGRNSGAYNNTSSTRTWDRGNRSTSATGSSAQNDRYDRGTNK